ncbi:MAG: tetratricopeptide repeat protein [Fidelibacterota bacterium]|nr:MAG: tetratricopeptide repeat protein [Candidatus Neomarinimicrobiota bacterium]
MRVILFLLAAGVFVLSAGYTPLLKRDSATYYFEQGIRHDEREDYERAEEALRKALTINSNLANAHLALGAVYLKTDRLREAEQSIMQTIHTLPRSGVRGAEYKKILSLAYNNLGVIEEKRIIRALAEQDIPAAESHLASSRAFYLEAMEFDPQNELAFYNWRRLPAQIIRTTGG